MDAASAAPLILVEAELLLEVLIIALDAPAQLGAIDLRRERRCGCKPIIAPHGSTSAPPKSDRDETMIRALVKAHRWRRRIERSEAKSITDLVAQEGVTDAYVCRLPLAYLAPDIVEAILDGRQPKGLKLAELGHEVPQSWDEQRVRWRGF